MGCVVLKREREQTLKENRDNADNKEAVRRHSIALNAMLKLTLIPRPAYKINKKVVNS